MKNYVRSQMNFGSVVCMCTPMSPFVPEMKGIQYATRGRGIFLEDVPLVEFMFLAFSCMSDGVTEVDPGLCCSVLLLSSAAICLC